MRLTYLVALIILALSVGSLAINESTATSYGYDENTGILTVTSNTTAGQWSEYSEKTLEIVIEEGVTSIGNNSFKGFTELVKLNIPSTVQSIGDYAFADCYNLKILKFNASSAKVGNAAFDNLGSSIGTNVTFGDKVTKIPDNLFGRNSNVKLSSISFSSNITEIGNEAFYDCDNVDIKIPSNLTSIGELAFYDCDSIAEIIIPLNVTKIGTDAFYHCDSVKRIEYTATSCNDLSESGCFRNIGLENNVEFIITDNVERIPGYLFAFDVSDRLSILTIGKNVTEIGSHAFAKYDGPSFILPDIKIIRSSAFENCPLISDLSLHSVETIESDAFRGCFNLKNVTITTNISDLTQKDGPFKGTGASDVTLNITGTESVPDYLFHGFDGLSTVILDRNITTIGKGSFSSCPDLVSINFESITTIEENAFSECIRLKPIFPVSSISIGEKAFFNCISIESLTFPTGLIIGEKAFAQNLSLKTISFSGTILSGGKEAFNSSDSLTNITFLGNPEINVSEMFLNSNPDDVITINFDFGIIDESTFEGFSPLFTIETIAETIGERAFANSSITGYTMDSSTSIGKEAFSGCNQILYAKVPDKVTDIGEGAFSNMSSLKTLISGYSLETVGKNVFFKLPMLERFVFNSPLMGEKSRSSMFGALGSENGFTLEISESIYDVPEGLMYGSSEVNVLAIEFNDSLRSIGDEAFANIRAKYVSIPASVISIGHRAFFNSHFTDIKISGFKICGSDVFSNCKNLITADITGCKSVPKGMFDGCISLKNIIIDNNLKEICDRSFKNTNIESITLSESVVFIGNEAFSYSKLTKITAYGQLLLLGENAFKGCSSLTLASIYKVQTVGLNIFDECNSLSALITGDNMLAHTVLESCTVISESNTESSEQKITYNVNGKEFIHIRGDILNPEYLLDDGINEFKGWSFSDGNIVETMPLSDEDLTLYAVYENNLNNPEIIKEEINPIAIICVLLFIMTLAYYVIRIR